MGSSVDGRAKTDMSGAARIPGALDKYVSIALWKHDEVSLSQTDGFLADRVSPAAAPRDHVIFDDPLGSGHHPLGDLP